MPGPYNTDTTAEELVQDLAAQIYGKVILTTGVSPGGLGAYFAEAIAKAQPKLLILAGRNTSKAEATAQAIASSSPGLETRLLELDLSSQKQVREAAAEVNAYPEPIDVLVNNAGIMASDYAKTVDGLESQFGTNHIGPWLFTNLIMGKLLAAQNGARVVNVSSDGHRLGAIRFADWDFHGGESYNKWRAYGQAKTANMLMAISLAGKVGNKGLLAFSLHPGVIGTNLSKHLDWSVELAGLTAVDKELGNKEGWGQFNYKSPGRGTATHVYASFDPSLKEHNGAYLLDSHVEDPTEIHPHAMSTLEAEKLWKLSEKIVGQTFAYEGERRNLEFSNALYDFDIGVY